MKARYARPVLCRLCGFPAPDGGVPVSQLDREMLSEWCLRMLDTELDQEGLEKAFFCQFCVTDSKFESENTSNAENLPGFELFDTKLAKWERYYLENLIQPCAVQIKNILPPEKEKITAPAHSSIRRTQPQTKPHQCPFCPSGFTKKKTLARHVKIHTDISTFKCQFCESHFMNDEDRQKHTELKHSHLKSCIYCNKSFNSRYERVVHMQRNHKDEVIKCSVNMCCFYFLCEADLKEHVEKKHKKVYAADISHIKKEDNFCKTEDEEQEHELKKIQTDSLSKHVQLCLKPEEILKCKVSKKCPNYFLSEEKRQKHVEEVHKLVSLKNLFECIYCQRNCQSSHELRVHVCDCHSDVKIKCKWRGCTIFFLSKEDQDDHFQREHSAAERKKKFQCPQCNYKAKIKRTLDMHFLRQHGHLRVKCPQCPKIMKSHEVLKIHMKAHVHTKCSSCHKLYSNVSLNYHSKKRLCKICNYVAKCAGDLQSHKENCKRLIK